MKKFKWKDVGVRCRDSKILCIHGIEITGFIQLELFYMGVKISIALVPYTDFIKEYNEDELINNEDLVVCDIVVIITNCCNNTIEIQAIKIVISALYFAKRMCASEKRFDKYYKNKIVPSVSSYHDFFCNYNIDGYYNADGIEDASWYVNIGRHPLENDDFERWTTRIYGCNLTDSYDRRDGLERRWKVRISVDDDYRMCLDKILKKINGTHQYAKKLCTIFKLYYEVLCDFKNPDYTVILYCTIFEMLLLGKDEDKQRKKVSARAACITANDLKIEHKKFIANQVYSFYRYRNSIIHDGSGLMDFSDEVRFNRSVTGMKSVIFSIIKYIVENDIKVVNEIINITKENANKDSLSQAFDYISIEKFDNNPDYAPCNIFFD